MSSSLSIRVGVSLGSMFRGRDFNGADRVASRTAFPAMSRGATSAACGATPSEAGSNSSSSSSLSSLFHRLEFCEVHRVAEQAHERYLDSAHEVNWLEGCLGTIEVALDGLEREAPTA